MCLGALPAFLMRAHCTQLSGAVCLMLAHACEHRGQPRRMAVLPIKRIWVLVPANGCEVEPFTLQFSVTAAWACQWGAPAQLPTHVKTGPALEGGMHAGALRSA